jgi:hypothetical protein
MLYGFNLLAAFAGAHLLTARPVDSHTHSTPPQLSEQYYKTTVGKQAN